MSNENQKPQSTPEATQANETQSPFLNETLPTGTPQGQQQGLNQTTQTSTNNQTTIPHYNQ